MRKGAGRRPGDLEDVLHDVSLHEEVQYLLSEIGSWFGGWGSRRGGWGGGERTGGGGELGGGGGHENVLQDAMLHEEVHLSKAGSWAEAG